MKKSTVKPRAILEEDNNHTRELVVSHLQSLPPPFGSKISGVQKERRMQSKARKFCKEQAVATLGILKKCCVTTVKSSSVKWPTKGELDGFDTAIKALAGLYRPSAQRRNRRTVWQDIVTVENNLPGLIVRASVSALMVRAGKLIEDFNSQGLIEFERIVGVANSSGINSAKAADFIKILFKTRQAPLLRGGHNFDWDKYIDVLYPVGTLGSVNCRARASEVQIQFDNWMKSVSAFYPLRQWIGVSGIDGSLIPDIFKNDVNRAKKDQQCELQRMRAETERDRKRIFRQMKKIRSSMGQSSGD